MSEPVFVLSAVRSGSTLLRAILNSHSQIHAPHETHFRRLQVATSTDPVKQAMETLNLNERDLEHLLWDRLLHWQLRRSGKSVLVEKTPSNVFVADRLATAWPKARFIFLIRHPLSIARSWHEGEPEQRPFTKAVTHTLHFMEHLERARSRHEGLTVRYEDLTTDPKAQTQRLCHYLGLPWEPEMVNYGNTDHGEWVKGIGDWREKIRSGTVQPPRPLPDPAEIPPDLREIARQWGYLS